MQKYLLSIFIVAAVTGCNANTKERLGITNKIPDEYQVQTVKPLIVPPHYQETKE